MAQSGVRYGVSAKQGGGNPLWQIANATIISGAINAIAGCADIDGNTTAQITISEAAGYAANHFAGDILKVEALFSDNTPGIRVFTIISSDTSRNTYHTGAGFCR